MPKKFLVSFIAAGLAYFGIAKAQQDSSKTTNSAAAHVMRLLVLTNNAVVK